MKNRFLGISLVIFTLSLVISMVSCQGYNTSDCVPDDDCYPFEIDSGYINIQVDYLSSGPGIPVILYEGYVEDQNIIWADTVYESEIYFWLPTKTRYAAEAYYNVGGQITVALDGKKLKEDSYDDCGETCYEISEITLDLKKL